MSERKASMGDKVYRGDVIKFIRNNISLGTFMKRTVKTANEACWDLCDKLNYVPAIEDKNEPHWIPVTESLPKEDGNYLVSGKWGSGKESVGDCEFSVEDGYFQTAWNFDVLAWRELPEPYKGVTE